MADTFPPEDLVPEKAMKNYRFTYLDGEIDEETGYLVVTAEFVAVCIEQGEVLLISPLSVLKRVRPVAPVAGRA